MRFIRKNGRVIPIKDNGSGSASKSNKTMSDADYAVHKKKMNKLEQNAYLKEKKKPVSIKGVAFGLAVGAGAIGLGIGLNKLGSKAIGLAKKIKKTGV